MIKYSTYIFVVQDEDIDSRSLALSVSDMKQLLQWKADSGEHSVPELEKHIMVHMAKTLQSFESVTYSLLERRH